MRSNLILKIWCRKSFNGIKIIRWILKIRLVIWTCVCRIIIHAFDLSRKIHSYTCVLNVWYLIFWLIHILIILQLESNSTLSRIQKIVTCLSILKSSDRDLFCYILDVAELKLSVLTTSFWLLRTHCQRIVSIGKGLRAGPAWIKMLWTLLLSGPLRATNRLRRIAILINLIISTLNTVILPTVNAGETPIQLASC